MRWFTELKVRNRLLLSFAVVLAMVATIVAVNLVSMAQMQGRLTEIVADNYKKTQLVSIMSEQIHVIQRVGRTVILLSDEGAMKDELRKVEAARKAYDEASKALDAMPASEAGRAIRKKIHDAAAVARPLMNRVIDYAVSHQDSEATVLLLKEAGPAYSRLQEAVDENIALQEASTAKDVEEAASAYASARTISIVLGVATLGLAVLIALLLTRGLTRQLGGEPGYAAEVAKRIADGDLSVTVHTSGSDHGSMLSAIKAMQHRLSEIILRIKGASDTIASATSQIASGNTDLSQRTEEQASSLEETASSMEELTGTVKQNAENARQANQLAAGASAVAVKGGEVVGQVVSTMSSINESSKKIADIIGVIDGIAFQTNILALNAAVEAARAGEQGRGFAVVASEVRTLAQRSAAAAKEIKALITDSVLKVEDGTRLVDEAGKTMEEIVSSVKRVTDIMAEIAAASQEQTSGIEQVNQAIVQMDQVTQQNAALVEEAAAAADSMKEQAQGLTKAVAIFKLAAEAQASTPAKIEPRVERRGPERAKNVTRLQAKAAAVEPPNVEPAPAPAPKKVANDQWQEF